MGIQNPFESKASGNSVVDALIGNAYEVVKYVAYYVKEIRYVAFNMEHVYRVSQNMYQNVFKTLPITALGTSFEVALPEGVTAPMLLNIGVTVLTSDAKVYGPSEATFTWVVQDGNIVVTIPMDAPEDMLGADIRCLINWQSPVVVTP